MKRYLSQFAAIVLLILSGACSENNVEVYNGPSVIHFLESNNSVLIDETNPVTTIEVGVTKAVNEDRVFNVEIDPDATSAVEGVSFELITPQVTIKAGEVLGTVEVQGLYDGAEPGGQLLKLVLSSTNSELIADFQNSYYLELYKFCDFDQSAFIGTFKVTETDYWQNTFEYEVEAVAGDDPYSIYVTGLWAVDEAVKISFDRKEATCSIPAQYFFDDGYYENTWIRSLEKGSYNTCMGTIKGLNYFIYPEGSNQGWDLGTFDLVRIK